MGKLRTKQEVSHRTGELRAGPPCPPHPLQQPPCPLFSLLPPASAQKRYQTLAMSVAGALIQIPPTYCVLLAGCLPSLSLSLLLYTLENTFSVARKNPCALCQVLG